MFFLWLDSEHEANPANWFDWHGESRCEGRPFIFKLADHSYPPLPIESNIIITKIWFKFITEKDMFGDISNKSWFKFNSCNSLNLSQLRLSGDEVGQCSILDRQAPFTIINIKANTLVLSGTYTKLCCNRGIWVYQNLIESIYMKIN